jgi:hypothetical protein
MTQAQLITRATHGDSLADILERVLNTGLVIAGDIRIKLCDVELLSIQLRLLICSVEKAKELGISWWWQTAPQTVPLPKAAAAPPPTALSQHTPESVAADQYRQFCDFQRYQEAMRALEQGPR